MLDYLDVMQNKFQNLLKTGRIAVGSKKVASNLSFMHSFRLRSKFGLRFLLTKERSKKEKQKYIHEREREQCK